MWVDSEATEMNKKRKRIIVGTFVVALVGWILGAANRADTAGYLIVVGIPLVAGFGWAFLTDGTPDA